MDETIVIVWFTPPETMLAFLTFFSVVVGYKLVRLAIGWVTGQGA